MKPDRITRVNELIRRELGVQLYRLVNNRDLDPAAITFTHALTSVDLRTCRVLVSIRGAPEDQERMLSILKRHRVEFQEIVGKNLILRYTPQIHFVLDHSVEQGDHVLEILGRMEAAGEIPADAGHEAARGEDASGAADAPGADIPSV